MYIPEHFAMKDEDAIVKIIQSYPLGVLVTQTESGLDANHIPFELDRERSVLAAHVARANPVWEQCQQGAEVLVIFRGSESYISPNWYPTKHETHRLVPTWNYEVVHVHGRFTVQDHDKFVRGVVARLTRVHEAGEPRAWKMGDSAPAFIDGMLKAIVGIEVAITRIEAKAKLSQNRELRDRQSAAEMLHKRGQADMANAMQAFEKTIARGDKQ